MKYAYGLALAAALVFGCGSSNKNTRTASNDSGTPQSGSVAGTASTAGTQTNPPEGATSANTGSTAQNQGSMGNQPSSSSSTASNQSSSTTSQSGDTGSTSGGSGARAAG